MPTRRSTTVEVALKWPAGLNEEALKERLSLRRSALAANLRDLEAGREMHLQEGHLSPASIAGYRRAELHLEAELAWHDELQAILPAIARGDDRDRPAPAPQTPAEVTSIRSWHRRRSSAS